MALPTDILHEVYGHLDDKTTIDSALAVDPDIVHAAVRHIRSPRVVEVSIDYLVAFTRLEHTTNILVRVHYRDLDTLRPLSHLRSLCVEVIGPAPRGYMGRLIDIFQVAKKRDDQYFVFKVLGPHAHETVCFHNSHCVAMTKAWVPDGFTYQNIKTLRPRCYFDLLQSVRPYIEGDNLCWALDIVLSRRRDGLSVEHYYLLDSIAQRLGERFGDLVDTYMHDFIADAGYAGEADPVEAIIKSIKVGKNLPWRLLHYYDIPDGSSLS